MSVPRIIVVGGGLAGLNAAQTLLAHGKSVLLLDKKPSLGGNSVKSQLGYQRREDCSTASTRYPRQCRGLARISRAPRSSRRSPPIPRPPLLTSPFGVDLSLVSRLGGHSVTRTRRDKSGTPGWAIISALMKRLTALAAADDARVEIVKSARIVKLLEEGGSVVGVEYDSAGSSPSRTGTSSSPLAARQRTSHPGACSRSTAPTCEHRPRQVQVHPTGFVDPAHPTAQTKFLAAWVRCPSARAAALRGRGRAALHRDCGDARGGGGGTGPVRLVLNAAAEVRFTGLMRRCPDVAAFAAETGIPPETLLVTFVSHGTYASGAQPDPLGKQTFHNAQYAPDEPLHVALITPVVHYLADGSQTMGGLIVDAQARVLAAASADPDPDPDSGALRRGGGHRRRARAPPPRGTVVRAFTWTLQTANFKNPDSENVKFIIYLGFNWIRDLTAGLDPPVLPTTRSKPS
ncbi:hypothetical protein C8R44DRAFT_856750 [Mycena epipterygia]|nr:hypothetical protein C8R44DRAFT_856750 [Mycena epipterygia]